MNKLAHAVHIKLSTIIFYMLNFSIISSYMIVAVLFAELNVACTSHSDISSLPFLDLIVNTMNWEGPFNFIISNACC
jgi:hypothetical protein